MIHILVLEDDARLNQLVCTYLNDCGFETKGCLNAQNAYDEMYNSLYDLIISDIMMPEIDGFEFAQTVRQVNKHIPNKCCEMQADQTCLAGLHFTSILHEHDNGFYIGLLE